VTHHSSNHSCSYEKHLSRFRTSYSDVRSTSRVLLMLLNTGLTFSTHDASLASQSSRRFGSSGKLWSISPALQTSAGWAIARNRMSSLIDFMVSPTKLCSYVTYPTFLKQTTGSNFLLYKLQSNGLQKFGTIFSRTLHSMALPFVFIPVKNFIFPFKCSSFIYLFLFLLKTFRVCLSSSSLRTARLRT